MFILEFDAYGPRNTSHVRGDREKRPSGNEMKIEADRADPALALPLDISRARGWA